MPRSMLDAVSSSKDRDNLGVLAVQYRPISELKPYKRNARTHSPKQIRQIAESIKAFGFTNPVLIDAKGEIIAGHGRVEAAKILNMTTVPTIALATMNEAQRRAYMIADNKLAELAGWDRALLTVELKELPVAFPDQDLTITGFETAELDLIILGDETGSIAPDPQSNNVPEADSGPAVSRLGDLWLLGPHRLLCADARDEGSYQTLLGDCRASLVLTDPPFNVRITGHARGLGRHCHPDFVMAAGELSEDEFTTFLTTVFRHMAAFSAPGALDYIFMDWRHLFEVLCAGRTIYEGLVNVCVWAKYNAGMGSLYRSQHELVLLWQVGGGKHLNNVELGKFGRNRSNIWHYAGANSFGPERAEMLALHPTVKPIGMLADAILDVTKRGGLVLDPFRGSGI